MSGFTILAVFKWLGLILILTSPVLLMLRLVSVLNSSWGTVFVIAAVTLAIGFVFIVLAAHISAAV